MRLLFLLTIALGLSTSAYSQDTSKSFGDMTYAELQEVNSKSLSKAEKKLYKKAFKAAKKAEKKRIKNEKKRQKAIAKKLKKVTKVHDKTSATKDEFEAHIEVRGPEQFSGKGKIGDLFGGHSVPKFSLLAITDPSSREFIVTAFVHTSFNDPSFSMDYIDRKGISPKQYAHRKEIWQHYNRAALKGGIEREAKTVRIYADPCNSVACFFNEDFSVLFKNIDLENALRDKTELAFKVYSEAGKSIIIRIPYEYLVGFTQKLATFVNEKDKYNQLVEDGKNYILASR